MHLDQIRRHRKAIYELAKCYGVSRVRVFGSVARGEAGAESDVDFLVDFEPGRSLLDLVGFEQDLEALLDLPVDVVAEGGISPYLEGQILAEALPL